MHTFVHEYYGKAGPHVLEYVAIMSKAVLSVGGCAATGGDGGEGFPATSAFCELLHRAPTLLFPSLYHRLRLVSHWQKTEGDNNAWSVVQTGHSPYDLLRD